MSVKSDVLSLYLCFVSCQRRLLERKGLVHEDIYLFHIVFNLGLCGVFQSKLKNRDMQQNSGSVQTLRLLQ